MRNDIVICLLAVNPSYEIYNFYKKFNYKVFIVIDDDKYTIPGFQNDISIIKINNVICEKKGYKNTVAWFPNKAVSRDEALYYFNNVYTDYKFIWFIEEDVFVPSVLTIENIDTKYPTTDLLVTENNVYHETPVDNHWWRDLVKNQIKIEPPYGNSMICAIRCSRNLMIAINDYVLKYNDLFMDEFLFNTIAIQNNLQINAIPELKTIVWKKDWDSSSFVKNNLYHPIKDTKLHDIYRQYVKESFGKSSQFQFVILIIFVLFIFFFYKK